MDNKLPKLISFSGRKQSGKTEMANICKYYGYHVINFADGLKGLICNILNIDIEFLNKNKDIIVDNPYIISEENIEYLSREINISDDIIRKHMSISFNSIRKILQILGTEIIREYNPLWHIDKIREQISDGKKYCLGDTRFLNEKKFIEENNGECWFIIRPTNYNVSNHYSETSLLWSNFDNVIVNNIPKNILIKKWTNYLNSMKNSKLHRSIFGTTNNHDLRKYLLNELKTKSPLKIARNNLCNRDTILWWCNLLMIQINNHNYNHNYDKNAFHIINPITAYVGGLLTSVGCIKQNNHDSTINLDSTDLHIVNSYKKVLGTNRSIITNNSQVYSLHCNDPFIFENIKLWDILPQKLVNEKIPTILKDNIDMLKLWIIGLIDGNGSVFLDKKTLSIKILAAKDIAIFLHDILPYSQHTSKCDDLYEIDFLNQYALDFANWLGLENIQEYGLKRKWNSIEQYKNLSLSHLHF
jgi:hypothetical protein